MKMTRWHLFGLIDGEYIEKIVEAKRGEPITSPFIGQVAFKFWTEDFKKKRVKWRK